MSTSLNPEHIITQLKRIVESDKRSEIRLNANGGNSILLVCPPELEFQFIEKLTELMPQDNYRIIDINEMLISFVEDHKMTLMKCSTYSGVRFIKFSKHPKEKQVPTYSGTYYLPLSKLLTNKKYQS